MKRWYSEEASRKHMRVPEAISPGHQSDSGVERVRQTSREILNNTWDRGGMTSDDTEAQTGEALRKHNSGDTGRSTASLCLNGDINYNRASLTNLQPGGKKSKRGGPFGHHEKKGGTLYPVPQNRIIDSSDEQSKSRRNRDSHDSDTDMEEGSEEKDKVEAYNPTVVRSARNVVDELSEDEVQKDLRRVSSSPPKVSATLKETANRPTDNPEPMFKEIMSSENDEEASSTSTPDGVSPRGEAVGETPALVERMNTADRVLLGGLMVSRELSEYIESQTSPSLSSSHPKTDQPIEDEPLFSPFKPQPSITHNQTRDSMLSPGVLIQPEKKGTAEEHLVAELPATRPQQISSLSGKFFGINTWELGDDLGARLKEPTKVGGKDEVQDLDSSESPELKIMEGDVVVDEHDLLDDKRDAVGSLVSYQQAATPAKRHSAPLEREKNDTSDPSRRKSMITHRKGKRKKSPKRKRLQREYSGPTKPPDDNRQEILSAESPKRGRVRLSNGTTRSETRSGELLTVDDTRHRGPPRTGRTLVGISPEVAALSKEGKKRTIREAIKPY